MTRQINYEAVRNVSISIFLPAHLARTAGAVKVLDSSFPHKEIARWRIGDVLHKLSLSFQQQTKRQREPIFVRAGNLTANKKTEAPWRKVRLNESTHNDTNTTPITPITQ